MKETILFSVKLNEFHKETPTSRRYIRGVLCEKRPWELRIIRYDSDKSVYLIEYDENGEEIIDTFHDDTGRAMGQAGFDWSVKKSDWIPHSQ